MANCLTHEQIQQYLSGKIDADQRAEIDKHLAACEACRRKIESVVATQAVSPQDATPATAETQTNSMPGVSVFQQRGDAVAVALETMTDGYTVLGILPRGGQAVVYKAVQKATRRTVAVKVLLQGQHAPAHAQFRFRQEIELVASLKHPNIVTIFDSGIAQGQYYYAMEFIPGKPLDEYIEDHSLSLSAIMTLFGKVTSAVAYAHRRGVIHRDLKPSNILVDENGEPHVLDFGLAKLASGFEQTYEQTVIASIAGQVMGTLGYMSPEQATADPEAIDVRTDVYSLGVILYRVLTEQFPYPIGGPMFEILDNIKSLEPIRPSKLVRGISFEIEAIIMKALAKEPHRRYQSASELQNDVENWLAGRPIVARSDHLLYVLYKLFVRNRYAVVIVGLLAVILLAFSFTGYYLFGRAESARSVAVQQKERLDEELKQANDLVMQISLDFALRQWRQGRLESNRNWGILRQDKRTKAALEFMTDSRPLVEKERILIASLGTENGWFADYLVAEDALTKGDRPATEAALVRSAAALRQVRKGDKITTDWLAEYVAVRLAEQEGENHEANK
jgi:hypothetical protein